MAREIRGIRKVTATSDGDTIHLTNFQMYRNGKPFKQFRFPKKSQTAAGLLRIRLLGIDTPELHYPGPTFPTPCPNRLTGPARPKIYPQDPWGTQARVWLNGQLGDGDRVIVELDSEVFDAHDRVLGYVWSVKSNWQKSKLMNVRLVEESLAFPYQIWPNLSHYQDVKDATKTAIRQNNGVFSALSKKLLTLRQVAAKQHLNEPFLYRKVVDGAICQVPPQSLLTRFVGDARTWRYVSPQQYRKIPLEYRIFFGSEAQAINAGFTRA